MNHIEQSILFFIFAIIVFVIAAVLGQKRDSYPNRKTLSDCEGNFSNVKEGEHCGVWDNDMCYKGVKKGNSCVHDRDYLVLVLIIISVILLIVGVVKLFKAH